MQVLPALKTPDNGNTKKECTSQRQEPEPKAEGSPKVLSWYKKWKNIKRKCPKNNTSPHRPQRIEKKNIVHKENKSYKN